MNLSERIATARGMRKAHLVVKNARIFHLTTGEFELADIAIDSEGLIVGVGEGYSGDLELDATGLTAVPGFIDAHLHLESTLMTPAEFERCALRHGVTTVACDPHELANVVGTDAFDYSFACAEKLTMTMLVRLSSCVPATQLETSGAAITADDLAQWHERHPKAALAELMNVPGVLHQDDELLQKVSLFDHIDGHCPLLSGKDLNAYISVGVRNDHECSTLAEAQEKLRRGLQVLIREGSAARNLDTMLPLLTIENSPFLAFCTDDRNPLDFKELGYIDGIIAQTIAKGVSPLVAYRVASWSAARGLGLDDRGIIAPGKRADIVLLSNFEHCKVANVLVHGHPATGIGYGAGVLPNPNPFRNTVHCKEMTAEDFTMAPNPEKSIPVIGVRDGDLVTDFLELLPTDEDVLPIAVIERHGKNGNLARGYVRGFGLKKGAIASSVGHDSHNLCVIGTNPADMALAINALRESQGGFVATCDGTVTALVPLPFAGLFSDKPAETIATQLLQLRQTVHDYGCNLREPFLQMAFLPLAVIPHLKLTDLGLVDVDRFELV
ncbi:MAG: adenine deaminase [Victivallales bacterium]|nr:adenine deaminase [Victivallales bacterium]